jgi:hypothetical protein
MFQPMFASAALAAQSAPLGMLLSRQRTRTGSGGPDGDQDDDLRWLMPLLAAVIGIATIFSR